MARGHGRRLRDIGIGVPGGWLVLCRGTRIWNSVGALLVRLLTVSSSPERETPGAGRPTRSRPSCRLCRSADALAILVLDGTGMRVGELEEKGLRRGDLDEPSTANSTTPASLPTSKARVTRAWRLEVC